MVLLKNILALGGLGALMVAASGGAAFAQRYDNHRSGWRDRVQADDRLAEDRSWERGPIDVRRARRQLEVLHMVYDHEIKSGHPAAAMRAHLRANAIRARLRQQRMDY